jgi:hypothetical protein
MTCLVRRALAARRPAADGRSPEFTFRHFAAIEESALQQATWNLCLGNEGGSMEAAVADVVVAAARSSSCEMAARLLGNGGLSMVLIESAPGLNHPARASPTSGPSLGIALTTRPAQPPPPHLWQATTRGPPAASGCRIHGRRCRFISTISGRGRRLSGGSSSGSVFRQ